MDDDYLPELKQVAKGTRHDRYPYEGYQRGWGLEFGDLRERVAADPLFQEASEVAQGRSVVMPDKRFNLYLLMRFFLPKLCFGHIIEFGVHRGGNVLFMASVMRRLEPAARIYALDTFRGMPNVDPAVDAHKEGDFADVDFEELREHTRALGLTNVEFRQGLFQDTAREALLHAGAIALAHIDCDVYDAVRFSYEVVRPFMVPGGYLVFDDATVSSCIGATEAVEEVVVGRDGLLSEQIWPHYVFRAPGHR